MDSKYMSIGRTSTLVVAGLVLSMSCIPALARDQWSTNHGGNNPAVDPRMLPGGSLSGYVPSFGTDFWKGQLANRIPAGTVLTAILEDNLSSSKNKKGDTFALTIDDGFSMNGKVLIPPKSKIIGTVMQAVSAKHQRNGAPGVLEISLQSLVLPDGSHYPLYGFIDGNPASKAKAPAKIRHAGVAISDYGQAVAGMAMSFVSGPGFMMKKLQAGLEFQLDSGDAVPIRLTRSMDINQTHASTLIAQPPMGLPRSNSSVPGLIDPQGPVQVPGFIPIGAGGAPNTVPTYGSNVMPPTAPVTTAGDPNAVFNQPMTPGVNDLPDPF
jgi:hypothetical protein